ncbi:PREDICTED: fibropellin-3-like [Branchiostoma belcheri]|uniref:Fibropellin-3-like n=1 Tax=Branchiostoma belcheri TaxID=7741 RepID=A0A6P4ZVL6_BRABE|nr:PREDICTED: fibropellin-3-like [Branchiostoma belcheri]
MAEETPGTGVYTCTCPAGWELTFCEQAAIDDCASSPCTHGTCVDGVNSYTCTCEAGYTGVNCDTDIDDCASSPCTHGTCVDGVNSYTCTCEDGWTGDNCETDIDECASSPCGAHGMCVDGVNSYTCTCEAGYTSVNCETDIDDCNPSPCIHGTCVDGVNSYTCTCEAGWTGVNCERDIDECASSPCTHGMCVDGVNFYSCNCETGWEGVNCQTDINECSPNNGRGPCEQLCTNTDGSFTCSCNDGYVLNQDGLHCDAPTQITEPPQDSVKNAGQDATFSCTATGHPRPSITWYHRAIISNGDGVTITEDTGGTNQHTYTESTLIITNLDRTDHGTYRCQASNRGGTQEVTVTLTVRERPDPPTVNSGLTSTNTTVMCTWSLPAYLGNLPVTGSRVQYREIREQQWNSIIKDTTDTNYDITGLDPFTLYEVKVAIKNDLGYSNDSLVAHVWTAEAAPGKVENLTVQGISGTEVKVISKSTPSHDSRKHRSLFLCVRQPNRQVHSTSLLGST